MFFLLYKHPHDGDFEDFLKISDHYSTISEDVRRCAKIVEDFRGRPKDLSSIHQRINGKLFPQRINKFMYQTHKHQ